MGYGVRKATVEEVKIYEAVESKLDEVDHERWERVTEATGDYVFAYDPVERKMAYGRLYGIAKRLGFTVQQMVTWYCVD